VKRREFIMLLGGAAAAWPLAARAQQQPMPVIGFLAAGSPNAYPHRLAAFRQGLKETGYVEGQNVAIEYRWAEYQYDRLPGLAAELVQRQVAVIAASALPTALAAKAATSTIPIVFTSGSDPVQAGLIASLNRPGGNLTGVSMLLSELVAKRVGLLHEIVPAASIIAVLVNPSNQRADVDASEVQTAARAIGKQALVVTAGNEHELDAAFTTLILAGAGALLVPGEPFFIRRREQLAALTARHAVPTIYEFREFTEAGGLMSYGTSLTDVYRQLAIYTGKILKGAKPVDLPVQQPTKFELIINLKTAKALGLTLPPGLLAIADEVIE
jgi:putative ABC transport system substrate-binding protein